MGLDTKTDWPSVVMWLWLSLVGLAKLNLWTFSKNGSSCKNLSYDKTYATISVSMFVIFFNRNGLRHQLTMTHLHSHSGWSITVRSVTVIMQFRVTIATKCRQLKLGYERANTLLFQCIVSVLWVLIIFRCRYVKCSVLYKADGLRLTICACYSWQMTLNVSFDASFGNM
jgi:hypothetical protein